MEDYSKWNKPIDIIIDSQKEQGNLYVGNYRAAEIQSCRQYKIGAVITAAKDCEIVTFQKQDNILHMRLNDADDVEDYDISVYFNTTFDFIDKHLQQTNVLVHCMAGAQRSVTIITAYLIRKFRWDDIQALKYVQDRREIADPNPGFLNLLKEFCQQILQPKMQTQVPQLKQTSQQNMKTNSSSLQGHQQQIEIRQNQQRPKQKSTINKQLITQQSGDRQKQVSVQPSQQRQIKRNPQNQNSLLKTRASDKKIDDTLSTQQRKFF